MFQASHAVYNSWLHRWRDDGHARFTTAVVGRLVEHEAVLMFAHVLYFNPNISLGKHLGENLNTATESSMPTS